jgi:protease I
MPGARTRGRAEGVADVNPAEYVALAIPGGRAPEYIRNDPDVQRIVRHFMESDQPVAQLCHAPQVLAAAGTLTGRRTAAYPALAPTWRPRARSSSTARR